MKHSASRSDHKQRVTSIIDHSGAHARRANHAWPRELAQAREWTRGNGWTFGTSCCVGDRYPHLRDFQFCCACTFAFAAFVAQGGPIRETRQAENATVDLLHGLTWNRESCAAASTAGPPLSDDILCRARAEPNATVSQCHAWRQSVSHQSVVKQAALIDLT